MTMTPLALWQRYADLWSSLGDAHGAGFDACLHEHCTYLDPNGLVQGRRALSDYMAAFRASLPAARFQVHSVVAHNDRTLSDWALLGEDGALLQTGRSFAVHDERGRLRDICGFFDAQPMAERHAV